MNQNIVDNAIFLETDVNPDQGNFFLERAKLSESFFEQLKRHPYTIEEAAIQAIQKYSMALDLYCWMAYRLHVLPVFPGSSRGVLSRASLAPALGAWITFDPRSKRT